MTVRIIRDEPVTRTTVPDSGSSGNTIMLMTFVALAVIIIAVLLILHFTTGLA